ncbi:MAG: hypothetical protein Unbinned2903contig1001_38 [Prokaryotic dsDNA virus sp.]|nr:MAG: hypothetical protein Unbinned2903contig1001_38 [Prokaryotic dsDNA virus sp.]|tara:strand:+ start:11161 stop:11562 length:402 start_codon:yes stop_codon:yes gene_type:complete
MKYVKNDGGRSNYFPSKLKKDQAGDCCIRAIAIGLDLDYMEVWQGLFKTGLESGYMPNSWRVVETYLKTKGWIKQKPFRKSNNRKYQLGRLPVEKNKTYLVCTSGHLTCVVDGVVNDTWDCREWCANSYYIKG